MKKILIFLFCVQLLSGNTFLAEMCKTMELIEHFQEHQVENPSINFLSFLHLHYLDQNHKQQTDEHQHHKHLPFDNLNTSSSVLLFCDLVPTFSLKKERIDAFFAQKSIFPSYEKNLCSQYLAAIFQPPRA